ncbi:hypothetical protein [Alkalihalobacterium alkalinitrilicum]|uniref:hypothetical protein n=1 Tax=Alkalihalobacterium alkalinitrilicum TaxID=427920 RepID=UPI0009959DF0|nr:hypothetical protein [Alkalihalobacterium alkalinitrilicum]
MVILWTFIILTILLITSVFILKRKMNGLSIIGCYLSSNIFIELSGVIININLKLTQSPDEAMSLWTQKIASIGAKPLLVIWAIFIFYSDLKLFIKATIITFFIFSLVSFELLFIKLGFLEFVKWNTFYEFLRYLGIFILTALYVKILGNLIKKELNA